MRASGHASTDRNPTTEAELVNISGKAQSSRAERSKARPSCLKRGSNVFGWVEMGREMPYGSYVKISDTPFGYYSPSPLQEWLIRLVNQTSVGRGRIRWWISALLQQIKSGPMDVERLGLKMRLHHYGPNPGEKKMLLYMKGYDWTEIAYLKESRTSNFRFVDIGANAGFYSFAIKSMCPAATVVAFEPNPILVQRLTYNARANNLTDFSVIGMAVGATLATRPYFTDSGSLLGCGVSIDVPVIPLYDSLVACGLRGVDAMKIDIEGFEDQVLFPYFETAPPEMWPRIIVIEHCLSHLWKSDCLHLCRSLGYRPLFNNSINAVLTRPQ
jgi:FkbM family methyltransferase